MRLESWCVWRGGGAKVGLFFPLPWIKSNSPYRTLFEEVIGRSNAVTRRAAAERFPCLPMLAGVIANRLGEEREEGENEAGPVGRGWEKRGCRRKHLMHVKNLIWGEQQGKGMGVCLDKKKTVVQGQENALHIYTLCNSIWERRLCVFPACNLPTKLTACVPASKFGHFTYRTLIVVFKSSLHARHSLADCVFHLQV